ncbi:hypothetical protein OE88DRAFT_972668 [Heliocybe sulcata]|uniref:Uncharacterized protein n=1 Tax=Heliocybe sulcata TaxID=5364 RepID=A0A5C3NC73_9AGAM|nr:hypothetical protein OE88DRAFT_972668 [Heliocybe sulcata]
MIFWGTKLKARGAVCNQSQEETKQRLPVKEAGGGRHRRMPRDARGKAGGLGRLLPLYQSSSSRHSELLVRLLFRFLNLPTEPFYLLRSRLCLRTFSLRLEDLALSCQTTCSTGQGVRLRAYLLHNPLDLDRGALRSSLELDGDLLHCDFLSFISCWSLTQNIWLSFEL